MFEHRRGVVLVTVNYRLGALGWMGGDVVQSETYDGNFDIIMTHHCWPFLAHFLAPPQPHPHPHTRRVLCSTWRPC